MKNIEIDHRAEPLPPARQQLALELTQSAPSPAKAARRTRARPVTQPEAALDTLLGIHDVEKITGRHCATIHRWMRDGIFPKKLYAQGRSIGWRRSDVQRWLNGSHTE